MGGNTVLMYNGYPHSGVSGIMAAMDLSTSRYVWDAASRAIAVSGLGSCYVPFYTAIGAQKASTGDIVLTGC
jgi:hypothetical protein